MSTLVHNGLWILGGLIFFMALALDISRSTITTKRCLDKGYVTTKVVGYNGYCVTYDGRVIKVL